MIKSMPTNISGASPETGVPSATNKPILVDLYCSAGGCTRGYQMAGFYVIGVDIRPQPRYVGDEFYQMDAFEFMREYRGEVAAYSASPPCQGYSETARLHNADHPLLIEPVRKLLLATGKPYVIENVRGAPLNPDAVMLVGSMFGLRTMRPRLFECSFPVQFVLAPSPAARHAKMGRLARQGEYMHIAGKGGQRGVKEQWMGAMGIDWMTVMELAQAIPPAYTNFIGAHLMAALQGA